MKYLIIDFEVFKFDTLFGVLISDGKDIVCIQTWDLDAIRNFYEAHKHDLWIGHNNIGYDNIILEQIVQHKNPYKKSKEIIHGAKRYCHLPILTHDTMRGFYSLKVTELITGKNISETPISFDLDRPLTEDEKRQIESYNRDDLDQTYENFIAQYNDFQLRLDIIQEFSLSFSELNLSGTSLAAKVLDSHRIQNIEKMTIKPTLPKTLQIKNQTVLNFYLNEDFKKKKSILVNLCNCPHKIAAGGIHAALKKVHYDKALYFDVSGYYNLIMLNYDLLPRTLSEKGKELYRFMYYEQLRLKKINPKKRAIYKIILLSVFGSMLNEHTDFYDPAKGSLVTIIGELFLVDLLEKLEGYVDVIQSNTDGIILEPLDWSKKDEIISIVEEWEQRTGFVIKKEEINNIWQRDVNNYMFDDHGKPAVHGEAVTMYGQYDEPIWRQVWTAKEAGIISHGIVDYFLYGISPEETVKKYREKLILFQYACKTMSYDYCQYEYTDLYGTTTKTRLQNINRAFASNDKEHVGTVIKYKNEDGKLKHARVQSLPDNVFIYNGDIRDQRVIDKLVMKINYQYYIDRIYKRCGEFIE